MLLLLEHPDIIRRSCEDCAKYQYGEDGKRVIRRGKPMLRGVGNKSPCRYGTDRCPKGTPEQSKALTAKNYAAYNHYIECKAVGRFPDDPIVRRNAAIIRSIEDAHAKGYMLRSMMAGAGAAVTRKG